MKNREIQWKIMDFYNTPPFETHCLKPMKPNNDLKSLMGLDIFIPTIYHYLKRDKEKPWNTMKDHELL